MQLTYPHNVDFDTQANNYQQSMVQLALLFELLSDPRYLDPSAGTHQVEQQHKSQNRDLLVH